MGLINLKWLFPPLVPQMYRPFAGLKVRSEEPYQNLWGLNQLGRWYSCPINDKIPASIDLALRLRDQKRVGLVKDVKLFK